MLEESKAGGGVKCLFIVLALLGVAVIALMAIVELSPSAEPSHSASDVYFMCRQFAEGHLVAPSTAKWGGRSEARITTVDGVRYTVAAPVDAQNAFGAMLRKQMACEVVWRGGDKWKLVEMDLR